MKRIAVLTATAVLALTGACGDDDDEVATAPPTTVALFTTLDRSGDSYLDADEVAEWVDDTGTFNTWDADADSELDEDEIEGNAFRLWDANGNKKIDESEWRRGADLWYPDGVKHTTYADWDGDGDSELDLDEFAERFDFSALGESWQEKSYNKEAFKSAYFELYDTDDDGRVSKAEWTSGTSTFGIPK